MFPRASVLQQLRTHQVCSRMNLKVLARVVTFVLLIASASPVLAQVAGQPGRFRSRAVFKVGPVLAQQVIAQGDANGDGQISEDEFVGVATTWFDRLDPDGAGSLSQEEFLRRFGDASGAQRVNATRALAVFTALDTDEDTKLTREEMSRVFEKWFREWDEENAGSLTEEMISSGIESVLPRNNLSGATGREGQARLPGLPTPPPAPVLSPQDEMETVQLVDGFHLELTASEPMVEDPTALSFDEDGRLYVLEMRSYQLDVDRTNERDPISRISRLEDTDGDGRFDKSTVFVDGLILPRALAAVRGGVMYVSDYQLHFAQDTDGDGRADRNMLLDADYGGGNVEHAPNGLMPAMDNWIYNAKSRTRYRWIGDVLVKQQTENRGQWGITQDNHGRLLYNINNSQLLGDYAPPNYMARNPNFPTTAGINLFVATDQRVFSARMNTGINRGYLDGVLDERGRAHVFASSCSPLIYRGDNFPADFVGNAFVADPAVNLIKRNLVFDDELTLSSKFAYDDREFIASTDERFRPVSLHNGPDGTLWVVDLYRGIAQYSRFMTSYLRTETLERNLDKGIHLGRIFRVVSDDRAPSIAPRMSEESLVRLVERLSHPNGWIRDTAQRLLVERGDRSIVPELLDVVSGSENQLARIHALWTLEGLLVAYPPVEDQGTNTLVLVEGMVPHFEAPALTKSTLEIILAAIADTNPKVQSAAMRVAESVTAGDRARRDQLFDAVSNLAEAADDEVLFQAALTAGNLTKPKVLPLLADIATRQANELLIRDAIVSGLHGWELQFVQTLLTDPQWHEQKPGRTAMLRALANAVTSEQQPAKLELLLTLAASQGADQAWRRHGLLAGVAAHASGRIRELIEFDREPPSLQRLARSDDQQTRERVEQMKALFSWPGHQSDNASRAATPVRSLSESEETRIADGRALYVQICAGCHGADGEGLRPLAPPLANSEWVTESPDRLIRIVLHGVQGTINVDGNTYETPDVLPEMPPLAALNNEQLAAVLTYVRHDWDHAGTPVSAEQVGEVRDANSSRELPWTESELRQIK